MRTGPRFARTSAREAFGAAAAQYGRGNPLLLVEREETGRLLPGLAGKRVLDLGAGSGYYAALATRLGAGLAVALDLTPEMLATAPRPAVVADAVRLPLGEASVDVVVAALLVSYVSDRCAAVAELARVLRPGGVAVLSDLHPVAAERGWRRTFAGPSGERLEVDADPPTRTELGEAIEAAGLEVEEWREPAVDERLEGEFRRAGRRDFECLLGTPLLLLVRAGKGDAHDG